MGIAPGVVGHQPFGVDAARCEPRERAADERGDGLGFLVVEQLDVGHARVVINDRVRERGTDPRALSHPVAAALRAIAGDAMPGPLEPCLAGSVHVQQISGTPSLIAASGVPRAALSAGRPRRRSTFHTVECGCPVAPATSRGPQPVRTRASQIRSCASASSSRGLRCGALERSNAHPPDRSSSAVASSRRCHHRSPESARTAPQVRAWRYRARSSGPSFEP